MSIDHSLWMKQALLQAEKAFAAEEVPVGAIVVHNGKVIGRGYNQKEQFNDPTAHAEMIAITAAANTFETNYTNTKYKIDRVAVYPSIEDQLDMQYWDQVNGTTTWKDAIAKVKVNYPKP